ncbi:hypothetical protein O1W68_18130 [Rhodococcus sp. H36-A4]|nr:hypothetical protein [Rhodococcus sp. H36-A4]MCZ4079869.1 hypothetical protein [Rhodococcus sp. H36-A4]
MTESAFDLSGRLIAKAHPALIADWRSPSAEPYFGATQANPMGLARRRRYRWTRGRVSDYRDEVSTADEIESENGVRRHAALDDHSAFIASLGSDSSHRMRDVLGTIQAEPNRSFEPFCRTPTFRPPFVGAASPSCTDARQS